MVSRGPSIHHTRKTTNPFMTTSSGIVGINLHEPVHFEAPKLSDDNNQTSTNVLTEFMYQPTSRAIGEGLQLNQRSILSRRMDKFSIHKEIEEKGLVKVKNVDVIAPHECGISPEALLPTSIDTSAISAARKEHPMYATSNREIGAEKPQMKVDVERKTRPNTFTSSFNGFRYRDYGLNTALSKSRICEQLDNP